MYSTPDKLILVIMKILNKYLLLGLCASVMMSCSTSRNRSSNSEDGVTPRVKRPGQSIINASGDGLTPGVNPNGGNMGTGASNAVNISNNAISKARTDARGQAFRLDSVSNDDFLHKAAVHIMMESNISKIASEKSAIKEVSGYARMIVGSHRDIQSELQKLSSKMDIEIPDTSDNNVKVMQNMAAKNSSASGASEFDFRYVQIMIDDHRNAIRLFEAGAKSKTPEVADFANKYLPLLRTHLNAAQDLTKVVRPVAKN